MAAPVSPRPLLVAEAANPEWFSVPLVGWSHSRAIAELTDGHIVTQVRNREAFLRAGLTEGEDFTAIDSEKVARPVYKLGEKLRGGSNKGWTTLQAVSVLAYPYFEKLVWKQFGERIANGEFNIVHRVTPLSPTTPSRVLAKKCKKASVPFVLGPLNGGAPWPPGFDDVRRAEREWLSYVRGAYKMLPGFHATRKNASAIFVGSRDTWRQMPKQYHDKCFYLPENGIDPQRFSKQRTRSASKPIRAVFIGRLVPYKGADMLLEAAAPLVRDGDLTIDILGDGPEMEKLKSIVAREKIEFGVTLAGWIPHEVLQDRIVDADLFTFPSVREFGGGVVLEAMAVGVVPVILDYAGPAELVTPDTGVAVPMGDRAEVIARFRSAFEDLVNDPQRIDAMSQRCLDRVAEQFTWAKKAEQVVGVYEWLLNESERPQLTPPL